MKTKRPRRRAVSLAVIASTAALALLLISAAQASAAEVPLTLELTGSGAGNVTSGFEDPGGAAVGAPTINCSYVSPGPQSGVCASMMNEEYEEEFGPGPFMYLTRHESPGSEFVEWSYTGGSPLGCCVGQAKSCFIQAQEGEEVEITAVFNDEPGQPVILKIEEGNGTVVSNPAGIQCSGLAPQTCWKSYESGSVELTASPAPGFLFKGWKGCDTGGVVGRKCTVAAGTKKTVGAKFTPVKALNLTSSGGGTVSTTPSGIACGPNCHSSSALYKEGSLSVKQKPDKHFHFVEFTGGTGSATPCNGETGESCTFSIAANSALETVFAEDAKNTLSLSKEGGGQGFVKTKASGINCGYTCSSASAEFFFNESVEVTVTLNKGTSSVTWTTSAGTCTGNALTCSVPMSEAHSLKAKFS